MDNQLVRYQQAEAAAQAPVLPYGLEFQQVLVQLLTADPYFAVKVLNFLEPEYFEHEVLIWAVHQIKSYYDRYQAIPTLAILIEEARGLTPEVRELYRVSLDHLRSNKFQAEEWVRDKTLDFVKRCLFYQGFHEARSLFNKGELEESYQVMDRVVSAIRNTEMEMPDRSFFFEEFLQRYSDRLAVDPSWEAIPTGMPETDQVLDGGLSIGEIGAWVAYAKRGKSTMLINLGAQAIRRGAHPVLHLVFEGDRQQTEARYDTFFANELYNKVKRSDLTSQVFNSLQFEYQMYGRSLVIRAFTEKWTYSCADIWEELKDLRGNFSWRPDLLVVDYGDLLRSQEKGKHNETSHQAAAFQDLKQLAKRGYALWTASQAQRPVKDIDVDEGVLQVKNVADAFAKVRIVDFMGTINQTLEERRGKQARLYHEIYRDNLAGQLTTVRADFSRMLFTTVRDSAEKIIPTPQIGTPIGYAPQAFPTQQGGPF